MKNELKKCHHCARHNWHENTHCSWCARILPKYDHHKLNQLLNHVLVLISVLALAGIAWGLMR